MKRERQATFRFAPFSRRQKQVITWWRPESPYAQYDGVLLDGAIRSGKTIACIVGFTIWSSHCFTGENFIISGKSMGALKRNIVGPMLKILRAMGIVYTYNRSENYLEFSGNTYYLFGANNEASQDVLQGLTAAGWLGDEVALQPQSFIEQAIGRCSVNGAKIWLNCNPESPHHYVKTDLIDKAEQKRLVHLFFTQDDNLTLSPDTKARYCRMYYGVWFNRFIRGLWVAAEGAIYDMLDESVHVVDTLPAMTRYWVGVDYGTASVTTFWLLGLGADSRLYFIDFWRWDAAENQRQLSDVEFTERMETWLSDLNVTPQHVFVPDDAASFITQLQQTKKAGKAPHLGGLAIADRSPGSVLRRIRNVSSLFHTRRLLFSRTVQRKGGLKEWCGYVWDAKKQKLGEDAPLKEHDHDPDAGGYAVAGIENVWRGWIREAA